MKKNTVILLFITAIVSFGFGRIWEKDQNKDLVSNIYKQAEVTKSSGDWGSIYMYNNEATTTYGTSSMLTAVLDFLPEQQLQPPHQHGEEEYSFIISGSGTWNLNGVESEIKEGDLMYAKPWDWHGIKNSSKTDTLKFFVMKWQSKGVKAPEMNKK